MTARERGSMFALLVSRARGSLGRNASALYVIHLASYAVPLISFPYLLRVLGPAGFGIYAFAIAIARYGLLVTDWGFAYTATRDLSKARSVGAPVNRIFSATMGGRLALLGASAIVLAILTIFVPRFSSEASLFWAVFAGVAGSALLPVWLFQAFERLPWVAGIQLASRVISTALIFVLVQTAADVDVALWLWSAPWILSALVALWVIRAKLHVRWVATAPREWWQAIRGGGAVFTSLAAASLYTVANVVFLGLLTNDTEVGYFAAAEVVVIAAVGLLGPISQVLFPRSAQAAEGGAEQAVAYARAIAPVIVGLGLVLSIGLVVTAPWLGPLIFGPGFDHSVTLLQIMSAIPFVLSVATVLGPQLMLTLRMDARYASVVIAGGVLNVLMTIALVPAFLATGTAVAAVVSETIIAAVLLLVLMRSGLNPLTGRVAARWRT
jgi:PST family polysaccharide transporter